MKRNYPIYYDADTNEYRNLKEISENWDEIQNIANAIDNGNVYIQVCYKDFEYLDEYVKYGNRVRRNPKQGKRRKINRFYY